MYFSSFFFSVLNPNLSEVDVKLLCEDFKKTMASEPSKTETDVKKFSLQCLAETLPNIYRPKYFVDENGRLLVIGGQTGIGGQ